MTVSEAMAEWLLGRIRWRLSNMTELALRCLAGQMDPEECRLKMVGLIDGMEAACDELAGMIEKANTPGRGEGDSDGRRTRGDDPAEGGD